MHDYKFSLISGNQAINKVEMEWKSIQSQKQNLNYFQSFEWHKAIANHLLSECKLFYVIAYLSNQAVAIFPLENGRFWLTRFLPISVIQFPSHDHIPLCDCISLDEKYPELISALIIFLNQNNLKKWTMLKLDNVRGDADILKLLNSTKTSSRLCSILKTSSLLDISESFEMTTKHMSKKFLKNNYRLRNKAEKEGLLEYKSHCLEKKMEPLFKIFLAVESDGWKGIGGTAISASQNLIEFYKSLVNINSSGLYAVVNILYLDSRPIAAQIGIKTSNRLDLLKIGYSERFKHLGPGNTLLTEVIKNEVAEKNKQICFVTCPEWAESWKSSYNHVYSRYVFNNTFKSFFLSNLLKLKRVFQTSANRDNSKDGNKNSYKVIGR